MKVEQLSVFIENKSGRLSEIAGILGKAGVNIRALSVADSSDFGILRIIVNDNAIAVDALKKNEFTVIKTEVLAVEVKDTPGGLAEVLEILERESINVEYMYAFLERSSEHAVIVFRFDDIDLAIEVLSRKGATILDAEKISKI